MSNNPKYQHYVPRTYLNGWLFNDTQVMFYEDKNVNNFEERNPKSVLGLNHTYTLSYDNALFMCDCQMVIDDFYDKICDIISERNVTAKYNDINICNCVRSIEVLRNIEKWEFKRITDGITLNPIPIINQIKNLKSYIIENKFSSLYETEWTERYDAFLIELSKNKQSEDGYRIVEYKIMEGILDFAIITMMRNPIFDFFGVSSAAFGLAKKAFTSDIEKEEDKELVIGEISKMERIYRLQQLCRALWDVNHDGNSFFHNIKNSFKNGDYKIIIFSCANGSFITSDMCSFIGNYNDHGNLYYFPLSADYMIAIAKMEGSKIDEIDCRGLQLEEVKFFNNILLDNATQSIVTREDISNITDIEGE